MKNSLERTVVAYIGLLAIAVSGCGSVPAGYANNSAGRASAAEMCESVRTFTRASLDAEGLRRAWFLPFGSSEDGSFDFYAPMASRPSDPASKAFYEQRVGQLTHYTRAPEFAEALASCLGERYGYARSCEARSKDAFRASFIDRRTQRSIEIVAANDTTSVLIADGTWKGDIEQALRYESDVEKTPNKSMQPTCEDARG
jgi:hypothetical protein